MPTPWIVYSDDMPHWYDCAFVNPIRCSAEHEVEDVRLDVYEFAKPIRCSAEHQGCLPWEVV